MPELSPVMISNKATVLIVSSSYAPVVGGVQTVAHNLAKQLIGRGHEVRVITNRYPVALPAKEIIDGVRVDRVLFLPPDFDYLRRRRPDLFAASLFYGPETQSKLRKVMRDFRPDVVNLHFPDHQIPFILKLRREFAFRLVVSLHGHDVERMDAEPATADAEKLDSDSARAQLKSILSAADAITACSRHILDKANQVEASVAEKGHVIYNGVDLERFSNKACYPYPRPYVLGFGRLTHKKGFDLLLRAFAEAGATNSSVDLIIAGAGEDRDQLKSLAGELGLDQKVHFFGEASPDEIVQLLNGCLFVAVPSRHEPFGIVALEALAASKRLLASRTGGLGEFLSEICDPNITLVEPTAYGLADGLRKLLRPARNGSSTATRIQQLSEQYSWAGVAKRYESVLIGGGRTKISPSFAG
ncbi:MAG: glycogen synthase [Blastocatellia bacterium]|jgi:glycosyltransferase involved in cell wall biosynthesis|nr:glycogen synthase [Blastocatellia bacterium]